MPSSSQIRRLSLNGSNDGPRLLHYMFAFGCTACRPRDPEAPKPPRAGDNGTYTCQGRGAGLRASAGSAGSYCGACVSSLPGQDLSPGLTPHDAHSPPHLLLLCTAQTVKVPSHTSSQGNCQARGAWPDSPGWASGRHQSCSQQQEALYMKGRELTPQLSQSSVLSLADSHTEFFDACEVLLSASSSENEVREGGHCP